MYEFVPTAKHSYVSEHDTDVYTENSKSHSKTFLTFYECNLLWTDKKG